MMRSSDVVVIGGGPSGVCAAIAAARAGASVTLMEKAGFLGGTATGAMVAAFNSFYWGETRVTAGIASDIVERLQEYGGADGFRDYTAGELTPEPFTFKVLPFDPEVLKYTLDDLTAEAGVDVVHHVQAVTAEASGDGAYIIDYLGPVRQARMLGRQIVDATGHATVAAAAGALLQHETRPRQPMTLMMRLSGVDRSALKAVPLVERRRLVERGVDADELFYRTIATSTSPRNGDVFLLMTAVEGYDGTDEFELTAAELEGRRQARSTLQYLQREMPGFERAEITQLAPWIGVRETRRISSVEMLRAEDVVTGADHPEAISFGGGPIDLHDGDSVTLTKPRRPFAVPLGVLIPQGVQGITVTGRAVGAEPGAMDGLRHMGGIMPLGHAAGVTAALAARDGVGPAQVDPQDVRRVLREQGAIVDRPDASSSGSELLDTGTSSDVDGVLDATVVGRTGGGK